MFLYFLKLLLQPFLLVAYNTKQLLSARYPVHPYFGDTSIFYCKWNRVIWEGTYERPDLEGQRCCGQTQQHPKRWVQAHRDMREVWGLQAGFPAKLSRSAARSEATHLCFRGYCPLQCILTSNNFWSHVKWCLTFADWSTERCFDAVFALCGLSAQIPTGETNTNCCFRNSFIKISTQHHSQRW